MVTTANDMFTGLLVHGNSLTFTLSELINGVIKSISLSTVSKIKVFLADTNSK